MLSEWFVGLILHFQPLSSISNPSSPAVITLSNQRNQPPSMHHPSIIQIAHLIQGLEIEHVEAEGGHVGDLIVGQGATWGVRIVMRQGHPVGEDLYVREVGSRQ